MASFESKNSPIIIKESDTIASISLLYHSKIEQGTEFKLSQILNFFALIESSVLYDTIWYFHYDKFEELQLVCENELCRDLMDGKIIEVAPFEEALFYNETILYDVINDYKHLSKHLSVEVNDIAKLRNFIASTLSLPGIGQLAQSGIFRMTFMEEDENFSDSLGENFHNFIGEPILKSLMSKSIGADYITDFFRQTFINFSEVRSQNNYAYSLYSKLSDKLKEEVSINQSLGCPIPLYIPPIASIILDRAGSSKNIYQEIVSLREEFVPFRNKYSNYQKVIKNPTGLSLGELREIRREALNEVEIALDLVTKKRTDSRLITEFFSSSIGSNDEGLNLSGALSLSNLLKFGMKKAEINQIKGRAKILFDIWDKVMRIEDYNQLVNKVLGSNITKIDIENFKNYSKYIDNYIGINRDNNNRI